MIFRYYIERFYFIFVYCWDKLPCQTDFLELLVVYFSAVNQAENWNEQYMHQYLPYMHMLPVQTKNRYDIYGRQLLSREIILSEANLC